MLCCCCCIHFNRGRVLLLLVIDVTHIDPQPPRLRVLLVLDDQRVRVQRLKVHAAEVVLVGEVEADRVGEIDVDLIGKAVLLPLLA